MGIKWQLYCAIRDYSGLNFLHDYLTSRKQQNVVFIWIPKSAGTSLHKALHARKRKTLNSVKFQFSNRGKVTFGHMSYHQLLKQGYISKSFDSCAFKFAIVRNPYDRAVSLYHYLKDKANRIPKDFSFITFLRYLNENGCEPIGLYNSLGLSQCNPQVRWIEGIKIDYIGRFENLPVAIEEIKNMIRIDLLNIPHENFTQRKDTEFYYCEESIDLVESIYEEDFSSFGYQKWK